MFLPVFDPIEQQPSVAFLVACTWECRWLWHKRCRELFDLVPSPEPIVAMLNAIGQNSNPLRHPPPVLTYNSFDKFLHSMPGELPLGFLLPILTTTVSDAESYYKMVFDYHKSTAL